MCKKRWRIAGAFTLIAVIVICVMAFWPWPARVVGCCSRGSAVTLSQSNKISGRGVMIEVEIRNYRNSKITDFTLESANGEKLKALALGLQGEHIWMEADDINNSKLLFLVPASWLDQGGLTVKHGTQVYKVPHRLPEKAPN